MHGLGGNDSLYGDIGDDLLAAVLAPTASPVGMGTTSSQFSLSRARQRRSINDFTHGKDKLDFRGIGITTFADVLAFGKTTADGAHSVFTKAGETVTVRWSTMASYVESDFVLGAAPRFRPALCASVILISPKIT